MQTLSAVLAAEGQGEAGHPGRGPGVQGRPDAGRCPACRPVAVTATTAPSGRRALSPAACSPRLQPVPGPFLSPEPSSTDRPGRWEGRSPEKPAPPGLEPLGLAGGLELAATRCHTLHCWLPRWTICATLTSPAGLPVSHEGPQDPEGRSVPSEASLEPSRVHQASAPAPPACRPLVRSPNSAQHLQMVSWAGLEL